MLDDRKLTVLRAIVEDYVSTTEPVGSKSLVDRHHFDVSSATSIFATPPLAGTRMIGSFVRPSNRITPSALHVPSDPRGLSQIVCAGPPATS